ncbi:MAG: hypothetical protein ACXWQO_05300 [Bdellovibrionota bacterium]
MDEDFENLKARAKKMAEDATENVKEKLEGLKDSPEWEEIRTMALNLSKEAAEVVRKYPLQSVAGAAAIGFVLSSLLNRRR